MLQGMRLVVIANPAAGQDEPILGTLEQVLRGRGVEWSVEVTQGEGDAARFAQSALDAGVERIAVYGGDGTVAEAASALVGSGTPLAILPGGTGNVIAQDLGLPTDLAPALDLCIDDPGVREVDVMRSAGRHFLLRVGVGADAEAVLSATRERKDRLGWLAYLLGATEQVLEAPSADYRLTLDGEPHRARAVTCVVANIARTGRGGLSLCDSIRPDDGQLDVILLRDTSAASLAAVGARVLGLAAGDPADDSAPVRILRGRSVRVEVDPRQRVHADGEDLGHAPVQVECLPGALRVYVPGRS